MIELGYLISYYNFFLNSITWSKVHFLIFVNKLFYVNKLGISNRITSHLSFLGT